MEDTFAKLKRLQVVLSKKFEIEKELAEIPKRAEKKTEMLNRLKMIYLERNNEYKDKLLEIKTLKTDMAAAEAKREELEKKMEIIKTQREYETLEKEIMETTKKEQSLRRTIQKENVHLEEMSADLEKEEKLINIQEAEVEEENNKVSHDKNEKQVQLEKMIADEESVSEGMDSEVLFKFNRILKNKSGIGIVSISRGVCNGCHMILPAQFIADVRKREQILFCPYCSRILYYVEVEEGDIVIDDNDESEDIGVLADIVDEEFFEGFDDYDDFTSDDNDE